LGKLKSNIKRFDHIATSEKTKGDISNPGAFKANNTRSRSTLLWFIADANVLIDYVRTSPDMLALVAKHLGPVCVEAAIVDEVQQLDRAKCKAIGLSVVQASLQQLTEASRRGGPLSFEDKLCLVMARDHGWICLSNDGALRAECLKQGITVAWGLEVMLRLIALDHLDINRALEVAESIHVINPIYITKKILNQFCSKARAAAPLPSASRSNLNR
jgi:rRNA-processing protein FCF1